MVEKNKMEKKLQLGYEQSLYSIEEQKQAKANRKEKQSEVGEGKDEYPFIPVCIALSACISIELRE